MKWSGPGSSSTSSECWFGLFFLIMSNIMLAGMQGFTDLFLQKQHFSVSCFTLQMQPVAGLNSQAVFSET